jgi:hypothetical protein
MNERRRGGRQREREREREREVTYRYTCTRPDEGLRKRFLKTKCFEKNSTGKCLWVFACH